MVLQDMLVQSHWQGVPVWEVRTPQCVARISCFGGQLLSWQPAGQDEVLWCSGQLQAPRPLRGGVPLCWPWFGKHPQDPAAPAHGLARTAPWQLDRAARLDDGRIHLTLSPQQPLHAHLRVVQHLWLGKTLEQDLTSHNTGKGPEPLSQALHTYLQVADVRQVQVAGLEGAFYLDALQAGQRVQQQGAWHFDADVHAGRADRIYQQICAPVVLHDPAGARRIQITASGAQALVLWTPGPEVAQDMADVGAQWPYYLCLEVANAGADARVLQPGQVHQLQQAIRVLP